MKRRQFITPIAEPQPHGRSLHARRPAAFGFVDFAGENRSSRVWRAWAGRPRSTTTGVSSTSKGRSGGSRRSRTYTSCDRMRTAKFDLVIT
jgi:hypothetical protein